MIPPCDPAVLQSNPRFHSLYQQLTTSLLNPDGSTRANDSQPAKRAVVEELKQCRARNAKKQIKKRALRQLAFDSESRLPDEYRDNVAVISLYLDSTSQNKSDDTFALLSPDIDQFYANLPAIINTLAKQLSSTLTSLRMIANPGMNATPPEPARPRHRVRQSTSNALPSLSSQLSSRVRSLRETQLTALPASRREMALTATEVLATRAQILEQTVVLLERTKHGSVARATKAKAEHLATVAQGVDGKLNVMKLDILAQIYTPETIAALDRYRQHLRDVRERLEEREALASEELKAVENRQPGVIGNIARQYGELVKEVEAVKMEIRRQ